jgi:hypothetical protein
MVVKFVKNTETQLRELREDGIRFKPMENLLLHAKRAIKANKADEAVKAVNELNAKLEIVNKYSIDFVKNLSDCRGNIELAKQIEQDSSEVEELLSDAVRQFTSEQFNNATELIKECKQRSSDNLFLYITDEIKDIYSQFKRLPKGTLNSRDIQKLFNEVDNAIQDRDYGTAIKATKQLKSIKDSLSKPIMAKLHDKAKDDIIDFQNRIEAARKLEADLTDANEVFSELVKRMKTATELSDYKDVIDYASAGRHALDRAIRRKERIEGKTSEVKEQLERLLLDITDLKEHVAIPGSVEELISKAKTTLKENSFEESIECIQSCNKKLDKLRKGSEPKIEIEFDTNNLQPNLWNRTKISVMNKGLACAKDLQVKLTGPLEVRRMPSLDKMAYNENKTYEIGLKPEGAGTVPVDIDIKFTRTWDGKPYHLHQELWLEISSSVGITGSTTAGIQVPPPRTTHTPPAMQTQKTHTIPTNIKPNSQIDCIYCLEPIKKSAPIFRCKCGSIYHLTCINEMDSCMKCKSPIKERPHKVGTLPAQNENNDDDIEWE